VLGMVTVAVELPLRGVNVSSPTATLRLEALRMR
jgi:hypothetical protein